MDLHSFFKSEVKPTIGCTEPGAVAYAAAIAAKYMQGQIENIILEMSVAIYKNGRSVGIPGTKGLRGLALATALGAFGGDPDKGLMSLQNVDDIAIEKAKALLKEKRLEEKIIPDTPSMWATVTLKNKEHSTSCTVAKQHDHVEQIMVDGQVIYEKTLADQPESAWIEEIQDFNFQELWNMAQGIDEDIVKQMLEGSRMNMDIIEHDSGEIELGLGIAKTVAKHNSETSLAEHIKEVAGHASDLRMSGGDVTVMSSAGSGNHGIVAVIPIAMTAQKLGCDDLTLAKALALSHLVCGFIKAHTGRLTPTCGCAMAAGAGAASGITLLHGGTPRQAELAAITLVGTLLGMICDGAKESCGLKVSSAASEAWSAAMLALDNRGIQDTQGIIDPDIKQLGATLKEFNEKIFNAADSVMISMMTKQKKA